VAYLRNRVVNLVNAHYGIHAFAQGMGGLFILVYLVQAGVSQPAALLSLALIVSGRFVLRPSVLPLATHLGLKRTLILGNLLQALQYPLLAEVRGISATLVGFCMLAALADTYYWTCYHAYFAKLGDREHRGHQVSAREAIAALAGIVAPLIGAAALLHVGPRGTFAAVAFVQASASVPLYFTPEIRIETQLPTVPRLDWSGVLLFAIDGWLAALFIMVWQLALFAALGDSLAAYGGAMSLAALVGAVAGLRLGRALDQGHGAHATRVALAFLSFTIVVRYLGLDLPWLAISGNAMGAIASCLYMPVLMTIIYDLAKASPCALRFHMRTEAGWDVGCACGCVTAAAWISAGLPIGTAPLLGLVAVFALSKLFRRHYLERSIALSNA